MNRFKIYLAVIFLVFFLSGKSAFPIKVDFINPGVSHTSGKTGAFWFMVSEFMKAAANDLGIELEVHYAQREYVKMIELTKKAVNKQPPPDYLIIVNEKLIANKLIKIAYQKNIKTLLILNDLTPAQKKQLTQRKDYSEKLLGAVTPDNVSAGYLIAKALIEKGRQIKKDKLQMIAINGSRVTPASVERETGLNKALAQYKKNVDLNQLTYGEWRKDKSYIKTKVLLRRYPDTDLIWTANDPMALGAVKAAEEEGKIPGKDIFIGGLNWSRAGLDAVKNDKLVITAGGHFMVGGFSLVILYDIYNGCKSFNRSKYMEIDVFRGMDKEMIKNYNTYFQEQKFNKINFKNLSNCCNPAQSEYSFGIETLIKQQKGKISQEQISK